MVIDDIELVEQRLEESAQKNAQSKKSAVVWSNKSLVPYQSNGAHTTKLGETIKIQEDGKPINHLTSEHGTQQMENVRRTDGKAKKGNWNQMKHQYRKSKTQRSFRNQKPLKIPNHIILKQAGRHIFLALLLIYCMHI